MGKDFGGRIQMRLSTGELISMRGTFNITPSRMSTEAVTNQDGSVDRTGTPKAAGFEFNSRDEGIDFDALMRSPRFNVTFEEEFTNVSHYFTDAFMVGDPSINRISGEVTGLSGASEKYNRSSS